MYYVTPELLDTLNIHLEPAEQEQLLTHLNQTLQQRVGAEITDQLDDDQLQELLALQQADDQAAIQSFLLHNVPELAQIVQDEAAILLGELAENSDSLSSNQA